MLKGKRLDSKDGWAFREEQLLFRRTEIYLAYTYFTQLIKGGFDMAAGMCIRPEYILLDGLCVQIAPASTPSTQSKGLGTSSSIEETQIAPSGGAGSQKMTNSKYSATTI